MNEFELASEKAFEKHLQWAKRNGFEPTKDEIENLRANVSPEKIRANVLFKWIALSFCLFVDIWIAIVSMKVFGFWGGVFICLFFGLFIAAFATTDFTEV